MATNKRPLVSTALPAPPKRTPSRLSNTNKATNEPTPTSSLPALPHFLTLPRPTIVQKFRAIAQHEIQLRSNPTAIFSHPLAISRNRYPDIHPWSHNRIHLSSLEFPYINASPIDLGRENERFIATQGPVGTYRAAFGGGGRVVQGEGGAGKEWSAGGVTGSGGGFGHFWEMVWQESVEVIVMLTKCIEEGREKCGVYYPSAAGEVLELEGDAQSTGNWGNVKCTSLLKESGTEIRELTLSRRKKSPNPDPDPAPTEGEAIDADEGEVETKKVWHFLFLSWPDQDVPQTAEDQKALLELIRMTRFRINAVIDHKTAPQPHLQSHLAQIHSTLPSSSSRPSTPTIHKPRIVHCSAGVGRTGTFIALDYLLQELEEGKFDLVGMGEDPIFECVKMLRDQRMYMVYKVSQYAYIYQVLKERWLARSAALSGKGDGGDGEGEQGSPNKKRKFSVDGNVGGEEGADPFR